MNREEFINEVGKLGITIDDFKMQKLDQFYHLLEEWNQKINLTSIVKEEEVYLKHFYDSLTLSKNIDLTQKIKICDVGSGAGFPGIVLKIFYPNLDITLIDSLNKRVIYLNEVINKLELNDIRAIHTRMEDYSRLHDEEFDVITARAVASLPILCEICVRALKIDGQLIFMKANCEEELNTLLRIKNKLKIEVTKVNKFLLPIENSNRTIISINKMAKTDEIYPRSIDKIKKNPL